jgi:hypothetical protein
MVLYRRLQTQRLLSRGIPDVNTPISLRIEADLIGRPAATQSRGTLSATAIVFAAGSVRSRRSEQAHLGWPDDQVTFIRLKRHQLIALTTRALDWTMVYEWYKSYYAVIAISKFKATCLTVLEDVRWTGAPVTVTRFGRPVAEIVPPRAQHKTSWLGCMKDSMDVLGEGLILTSGSGRLTVPAS